MGNYRYGVILDAGSSGSRVYVYRWLTSEAAKAKDDGKKLERLPRLKTKKNWHKKVKPGISTFGETPQRVGEDHLKELVDFALDIVPEDEVEQTPIFLLATAGMRLLPEYQQKDVLANVCAYFQQNTHFELPDCGLHVQVIPGETEGLYGWIAANYLLGGFDAPEEHDHGKGHNTYGFLDMGGASAQIAFAPNATEAKTHAEDLKLLRLRKINGDALEYKVFVTTWLGFGANEARRRYVKSLLDAYPEETELPDPCLPAGLTLDTDGHDITPHEDSKLSYLMGTGDFTACLKATYPLLEKEKPCEDAPCLLNGVHTPAIDFDVNHFVGVSEYWHTTHEVFAMAHKDKAYDLETYQKQVTELCSQRWTDLEKDIQAEKWGRKVDKKTIEEVCFKASWLISMLHDGIGVPRQGIETKKPNNNDSKTDDLLDGAKDRGFLDPFQAVDKIDGTEVSWTLGKMVLYASSQMPATDEALAVGFGSNQPGKPLPSDFQHAGGKYTPSTTPVHDDNDADDWHDHILTANYSRRVPGIIIFLLILLLATYLLCGRDRRHALHHKILFLLGHKPSSPRSRRRKNMLPSIFGSQIPSSASSYAALEAAEPEDFELSDVDPNNSPTLYNNAFYSDTDPSQPTSTNGRTSGWATPATRALSPDLMKTSPSRSSAPAGSSGLGILPFSRTESRERLASLRTGSRAGSPKRSPLIAPLKEI
ncbi:Hypothetical protein R9X50_00730100 [Acrodontium crateriforme]|uniref:Nucleoside diphosphatase n=1 Tax=Acrodontium crateriforme TaxID=150365 RepID=A0AAQ3RCP0_9PEZI|nr:Hypothetical protein R9X50_00730100 [Acrodontium crateriforme]